jgi:hypothetical protein
MEQYMLAKNSLFTKILISIQGVSIVVRGERERGGDTRNIWKKSNNASADVLGIQI